MGADLGPLPLVQGAVAFLRECADNSEFRIILVGDEEVLREHLSQEIDIDSLDIEISHAPEAVDMHMPATDAIRRKESSMAVAVRMQKEGQAQAVVSAGNTGAFMANSVLTLGRIAGVSRPAIAGLFPNMLEKTTVLLDVGANVDVKPDNILQFAQMGASYTEDILKVASPRVGLLSIGEESTKGNDLTLTSHELLRQGAFNFVGNVEGRDIMTGSCDVVVCDGFIGNILLKFAESVKTFLETRVRKQISSNLFSKAGAILMGPFLRRMRKSFDYAEYGGAPLLGIDGNCVVSHGKSSALAIKNAIRVAGEMITTDVRSHIRKRIEWTASKAIEN
jgi:glycerol-3-phosphate acyltransferase PlsX